MFDNTDSCPAALMVRMGSYFGLGSGMTGPHPNNVEHMCRSGSLIC